MVDKFKYFDNSCYTVFLRYILKLYTCDKKKGERTLLSRKLEIIDDIHAYHIKACVERYTIAYVAFGIFISRSSK